MLGSLTAPGRPTARDSAAGRVAFQVGNPVGTRDNAFTRLNGQPALIRSSRLKPLPTLRPAPRGTRRTARGRCDSL